MILVDSSVWIDYLRGHTTAQTETLDRLLGRQPLAIGDLILTEVLQGCVTDRDFRQAKEALSPFTVVALGGESVAIRSAMNFRRLRAAGVTVRKTIDCLIATWCIENGCPLLHSDRDFSPFVRHLGLRVL